jgi:hypothetical protein
MRHRILGNGGFTELSQYGTWDTGPTPAEYVARVRRYRDDKDATDADTIDTVRALLR